MKSFIPKFKINIEKRSSNGEIVSSCEEEGHSWTRVGWNMTFAVFVNCSVGWRGLDPDKHLEGKAITGSTYGDSMETVRRTARGNALTGIANNSTQGIVVGSDDTAFSQYDFKLGSIIPSGESAGQLYYGARTWGDDQKNYNSTTKVWEIIQARDFENRSGNTIDVKEVGLYWKGRMFHYTTATFCIARDVLESPIAVLDQEILRVTYKFYIDLWKIDA